MRDLVFFLACIVVFIHTSKYIFDSVKAVEMIEYSSNKEFARELVHTFAVPLLCVMMSEYGALYYGYELLFKLCGGFL